MEIEVVYAAEQRQTILRLLAPETCTISHAIELSNLLDLYPELDPVAKLHVGIFGKLRSLDWPLKAGDRVEIYRQLAMDPMAARKVRAKQQAKVKAKALAQAKIDKKTKK